MPITDDLMGILLWYLSD